MGEKQREKKNESGWIQNTVGEYMNINGVDISKQLLWKQINIFMTLFLLEITDVYVVKQLKDITSQNAHHNPFYISVTH